MESTSQLSEPESLIASRIDIPLGVMRIDFDRKPPVLPSVQV